MNNVHFCFIYLIRMLYSIHIIMVRVMADQSIRHLLQTHRFLPLFLTQFSGAYNDNVLKNALVIIIAFQVLDLHGMDPAMMVTMITALFILPFFLFSATAGQLADREDKAILIRRIKLAEIGIMLIAAGGLLWQSLALLVGALFLMGVQSSFFGPIKYGILPDHLKKEELVGANGLISGATFLAILLGTMTGGLLVMAEGGGLWTGILLIAVAVSGWLFSRHVPAAPPYEANATVSWHIPRETWRIMRYAFERPALLRPMLAVSWFWLLGAAFMAQLPTFTIQSAEGNHHVVTLLLTVFSISIGIGSLLCNTLLKGKASPVLAAKSAMGMSAGIGLLWIVSVSLPEMTPGDATLGAAAFLQQGKAWAIMLALGIIALCGGIFIVPLNALVQSRSEAAHRARVIAVLNIFNALFMVASGVLVVLLLATGLTSLEVFVILGLLNLGVAGLIHRLVLRYHQPETQEA